MVPPEISWPPARPDRELLAGEVHVWAFTLDAPLEQVAAAAVSLSSDERQRADQFRFLHLRERFMVGRGMLRRLLGGYLGRTPGELAFDYSPRGKPHLAGNAADHWHFNLAHSAELALIAITQIGPVGVDVEKIRPMPDAIGIAQRFFSSRELAALQSVPAAERDAAFFRLWTRKEAWLKATGDGIAESLSKCEMAFLPGEESRVLTIDGDAQAAAAWKLFGLQPADGFTGALAIRSPEARLRCWRFGY